MSHHEREVIGVDDRVSPARAIPLRHCGPVRKDLPTKMCSRGELFAHGASNTVP